MFRKILVCLDGSEFSEQILPYALAEARKFNSRVVLLNISTRDIPIGRVPISGQVSFFPFDLYALDVSERDTQAIVYLRRIANELMTQGLDVDCVVLPGWTVDIGDIIISYSLAKSVDLIAMATHGRTGWKRLLFGSVTSSVTRRSSIPVLVVRPGNADISERPALETAKDSLSFSAN